MYINKYSFIGLCLLLDQIMIGPCSAQLGKLCSSDQIQSGDLVTCLCSSGKSPTCQPCPLGVCEGKSINSFSKLNPSGCGKGCVDENRDCDSCYIWFSELCHCLQLGDCRTYQPVAGNPAWVLMDSGRLMTTTRRTPGILQLDSEDPWHWGQSLWARNSQALTINSVYSRSQEQVHIHICPAITAIKDLLGRQNYDQYLTMSPLVPLLGAKPWQCRVEPTAGQPIRGVMADIKAQIPKASCANYVGAAVIADSHDRSWVCVTTDNQATQYTFCTK